MHFLQDPFPFLSSLFDVAVDAAQASRVIGEFLPEKPSGRIVVIGAGKGSAHMGKAFEHIWMERYGQAVEGAIVTAYGHGCACEHLEIIEASHPVPDEAGLKAARHMLERVSGLNENDLVVALISGGGSALLPAPPVGISLNEEIAVNQTLLASGAPISAMNTVRKHVSDIKGGRLAKAAFPARVVSLLVSDIPGDHARYIASGPTVPCTANRQDALAIIRQYDIRLPRSVMAHLNKNEADAPKPDDPVFARCEHHIVASASRSLEAAQTLAQQYGVDAHILSDAIEGEAREAARSQSAIAKEIRHRDRPFAKPALLLSGGETTVTLKGTGRGGRNTEFLLSLAIEFDQESGIFSLCADTDGIDGSENNAGAFVDCNTVSRMRAKGVDPVTYLQNNDAWSAFDKVDALFIPGPTGTNVNDFRAILITG